MKNRFFILATMFACAIALFAPSAVAADANWQGTSANWNASNVSPGWDNTYPDAIGAIANFGVASTGTTTVNTAVTVGTLSLTNNSNNSRTITLTSGITLNQDTGGSGSATISNTNTSATTSNTLIFGGGTLTLADNLLISNTGASTRTSTSGGAIEFQNTSVIAGTGNLTLANVLNDSAALTGAIRFNGGTNTFSGTVLVQKGLTSFNNNASFGNIAGNTITIGQSSQGSATLLATSSVTVANNIVVASGSGGTLILGGSSTGQVSYNGTVLLNGDLTLQAASTTTNTTRLGGAVSGAGGIIKTGTGNGQINAATNSYNGATSVTSGTLILTGAITGTSGVDISGGTLQLGAADRIKNTANLTMSGGTFSTGATTGFSETIGTLDLNTAATITLALGTGVHSLNFADSHLIDWTGSTLTITGWTGTAGSSGTAGKIFFGSSAAGLTSGQLSQINFTGYANGATILSTGEIVAVPEPATWALLAFSLTTVMVLRRRKS